MVPYQLIPKIDIYLNRGCEMQVVCAPKFLSQQAVLQLFISKSASKSKCLLVEKKMQPQVEIFDIGFIKLSNGMQDTGFITEDGQQDIKPEMLAQPDLKKCQAAAIESI